MRADRFGSYSIAATFAGTPSFVRLKSTVRKRRLCPPPLCRVVMRPRLFRPPFLVNGSSSDFSGSLFVMSSNPDVAMKRRPGLVGLYFFRAISGRSRCRSCAGSAKREQRKDAGSARKLRRGQT
jgi:hypothetical protein